MEELKKDQTSKADPDDQVAPTKEQEDNHQTAPKNKTGHAQPERYYITVARALLDIKKAEDWVFLLKRIYGPLKRSMELFKEHNLAESTTPPERVLISPNPSPSEDRTLAAKQRIQSAHLFLHQTILDARLEVPGIPPIVFHGVEAEKKPLWWRIGYGLSDGDWFSTRNHFAHSFGIPPEARPPVGYPSFWDDVRIFQWVQDKYAVLEPAARELLAKLEAAIEDKEHWTTDSGDHMRFDLDQLKYRQDIEGAELLWLKYLREKEESYKDAIKINEQLQKLNAYKAYTEKLKSERELAQAMGPPSPTHLEPTDGKFQDESVEEQFLDMIAKGQTLRDVTDRMIKAVLKDLGELVDESVGAVVEKAKNEAEAGPATEPTAESIIPPAKNEIAKAITKAITEATQSLIPYSVARFIADDLKVEEALEVGSIKGYDAGTNDKEGDWDRIIDKEGDWDEKDPSDSGFDQKPPL